MVVTAPSAGAPNRCVLFIGPSLSHAETAEMLTFDAELRPPVRRGDLEDIAGSDVVVGMVDGVFHTHLAVSVREVRNALRRGVRVFGGSSMGALRAAELHTHGMVGVGEVFKMYREGVVDSDAEVALTFDSESFRSVSEPLVNVRYALRCAVADGIVSDADADRLLGIAKGLYFYDLTYSNLLRHAKSILATEVVERLSEYLRAERTRLDLKRRDAIELVGILNALMGGTSGGALDG